jgi:alpha-tubulin suppressor-like RCC1 family protein
MAPKSTRRKVLLIGLLPLCAKGVGALTFDAGTFHTCAVQMDGKVMCWGYNTEGQLGDGTTTTRSTPVEVLGITTARSVATGGYESCAVLSDGKVKCWGDNQYGGLGDGTTTDRATPVEVSGITTATEIAVSYDHSCALLSDGKVKCWGLNDDGQLGDGTTTDSNTPVDVSGITTATSIAVGGDHSCALLSDKTIKCWGSGSDVADGTLDDRSTPVIISGITTATSIATNFQHSCAVLTDGTIECWGFNAQGQLGDGTTTSSFASTVTVSGITTATSIDTGSSHSCAVLTDGKVKCWGENDSGQLGDGTTTDRTTPVEVSGITTATSVVLGDDHSCAVLTDGTAKCWGDNSAGELGDGTTTDRTTPVEVTFLLSPPSPPPPSPPPPSPPPPSPSVVAQTSSATSCYVTVGNGAGGFMATPVATDMRAMSSATDFYRCIRVCQKCVANTLSGCSDADKSNSAWVPFYYAFTTGSWTSSYESVYKGTGFKNLFDCGANDCNTVEPKICDDDYVAAASPPPAASTSTSYASSSLKTYISLAAVCLSLMLGF